MEASIPVPKTNFKKFALPDLLIPEVTFNTAGIFSRILTVFQCNKMETSEVCALPKPRKSAKYFKYAQDIFV